MTFLEVCMCIESRTVALSDIKAELGGVCSLHHVVPWDWTPYVRIGSEFHYLLTYLKGPWDTFFKYKYYFFQV